MKLGRLSVKKMLILLGVLTFVLMSLLYASQSYFSYLEVSNLADKCYDAGGLPSIKKTGFKVDHFSCAMD
jgi:hypothetical protein